jgi:hypothetical protein
VTGEGNKKQASEVEGGGHGQAWRTVTMSMTNGREQRGSSGGEVCSVGEVQGNDQVRVRGECRRVCEAAPEMVEELSGEESDDGDDDDEWCQRR